MKREEGRGDGRVKGTGGNRVSTTSPLTAFICSLLSGDARVGHQASASTKRYIILGPLCTSPGTKMGLGTTRGNVLEPQGEYCFAGIGGLKLYWG